MAQGHIEKRRESVMPDLAASQTPDDALRLAIKAAVDAGDFDRVRALVAVLEGAAKSRRPAVIPAPVVDLSTRRAKR